MRLHVTCHAIARFNERHAARPVRDVRSVISGLWDAAEVVSEGRNQHSVVMHAWGVYFVVQWDRRRGRDHWTVVTVF